jgi:hypothetical protein
MNHILDGIKTEAGKRLWTKINDNYGSSVWGPVGDGIVEIEAEVEERIIKLLEKEYNDTIEFFGIALAKRELDLLIKLIALIKGENKTNPWTSRPLTEEDKEHYGLEGENK